MLKSAQHRLRHQSVFYQASPQEISLLNQALTTIKRHFGYLKTVAIQHEKSVPLSKLVVQLNSEKYLIYRAVEKKNMGEQYRKLAFINSHISQLMLPLNHELESLKDNLEKQKELEETLAILLLVSSFVALKLIREFPVKTELAKTQLQMQFKGYLGWLQMYELQFAGEIKNPDIAAFKTRLTQEYYSALPLLRMALGHTVIDPNILEEWCDGRNIEAAKIGSSVNIEVIRSQSEPSVLQKLAPDTVESLTLSLNNMYYAKGQIAPRQFMIYIRHMPDDVMVVSAAFDATHNRLNIYSIANMASDLHGGFLYDLHEAIAKLELPVKIFMNNFNEPPQQYGTMALCHYHMARACAKLSWEAVFDTPATQPKSDVPIWLLDKLPCNKVAAPFTRDIQEYLFRYYLETQHLQDNPPRVYARHLGLDVSKLASDKDIIEGQKFYNAQSADQAVRRGAAGFLPLYLFRWAVNRYTVGELSKKDTGKNKTTALHLAVQKGDVRRLMLLIEQGVRWGSKDVLGRTAKDLFEALGATHPLKQNAPIAYFFQHNRSFFAPVKTKGKIKDVAPLVINEPLKPREQNVDEKLCIDFSKMRIK